ncbi:hypothetical protein AA0488_2910 [Kozakia baliensis NRIC 0488]|nr:hypothetical protein AA0488_2910 [Kozakia baliensis NRIC 0488]
MELIEGMRSQMATMKQQMRTELPKIYNQELLNNLFRHPYTKIEYVQAELNIARQTAEKYLDQLSEKGLLSKRRSGRSNYYVNAPLVRLFLEVSGGFVA